MSFPQSNNSSNANPYPYYQPGYGAPSYPVARPVHNSYLPPAPVRSFYPYDGLPEGFEWQRTREVQWIHPVIRHEPGFGPIGDGRIWGPISIPIFGMAELREVDIFVMVRKFQSPVPTSQPPSVSTQPAAISSTSTSTPTDKTEGNKSEKSGDLSLGKDQVGRSIDGAPEEQSHHTPVPEKKGDLALPSDPVGHAALASSHPLPLSQLLEPSAALEEYFSTPSSLDQEKSEQAPNKSQKTPEEILDKFLGFVKAKTRYHYRQEYLGKVARFKSDSANNAKWEDAMLHDPPTGLLLNLDKIAYYVKPKDEERKKSETTFLFPLRIQGSKRMSPGLRQNKEKMCLELALKTNGKAIHIFLRALRGDDQFKDRVLGENKGNVEGSLFQSAFPSFEEVSQIKTKAEAVSPQNPVVDEGIDLRFYSEYGAHILAKKKD